MMIKRFNFLSLSLVGIFYVIFIPILILTKSDLLPETIKPPSSSSQINIPVGMADKIAPNVFFSKLPVDASQWYIGAKVFADRDWDNFYPSINQDIYTRPNNFQPYIETPLFKSEITSYQKAFYPTVANRKTYFLYNYYGIEWLSRYSSSFWKSLPIEVQNSTFNFIMPPPVALIFSPIVAFDINNVMLIFWPILTSLSLFGIVFFAEKIYRYLNQKESLLEGIFSLASLSFIYIHDMNDGNVSQFLSFFITWMIYAWITGKQFILGTAFIPPLVFKGLMLNTIPLLLLEKKIKRKTVFSLFFWAVVLNGGVFCFTGLERGLEIYQKFFTEIIPCTRAVLGYSYINSIAGNYGFYPEKLYLCLNIICLVTIYIFYWKNCRKRDVIYNARFTIAAICGTILSFLMFNNLCWNHYFPFFFFLPFSTWLCWEIKNSNFMVKILAGVVLILGVNEVFLFSPVLGLNNLYECMITPILTYSVDLVIWLNFIPSRSNMAVFMAFILVLYVLKKHDSVTKFVVMSYKMKCVTALLFAAIVSYLALGYYFIADARQFVHIGNEFYQKNDFKSAKKQYTHAAKYGNSEAQYQLAKLYEDEKLNNKDESIINKLYLYSALRGNSAAMVQLGKRYEDRADNNKALVFYAYAGFYGNLTGWEKYFKLFGSLKGV